jgi:hypothetical protein
MHQLKDYVAKLGRQRNIFGRAGTQHLGRAYQLVQFDVLANCGVLLTPRARSPRAHCSLDNRPLCTLHAGCESELICARSRSCPLPTLTLQVNVRAD